MNFILYYAIIREPYIKQIETFKSSYVTITKEEAMEKFKLNIEYKVGKAVFSTNLFETEHFKISYKATKSHITLNMTSFVPLEILNLTASVPYTFKADSRVFANGYQSWTECREMFKDEKQSHTSVSYTHLRAHET